MKNGYIKVITNNNFCGGYFYYMEIAVPTGMNFDFISRVKAVSAMCKVANIEKMLSDSLENLPDNNLVNYVGELNKSDVMH